MICQICGEPLREGESVCDSCSMPQMPVEIIEPSYEGLPAARLIDERPLGRRTLKGLLKDANSLTICDPYLFNKPVSLRDDEYVKELVSVLPVDTLVKLDIFYRTVADTNVTWIFAKLIKGHGIHLERYPTQAIHDRVWIVDGCRGFVVGTSFGGIGNKLAFILDLPDEDLTEFKKFLYQLKRQHTSF